MLTPLDEAHGAMTASPDDETAGMRFYERLCDAELFLILEEEASDDIAKPKVFETEDGKFALVFDREDRLADFVDSATPFVAMSGRSIAKLLSGEDIGLGVNLGVAPSATLLGSDTVDWLNNVLGAKSIVTHAKPSELLAPTGLPESLITALDVKLANMSGVVAAAYLVGVVYENGHKGHLLALIDVPPAAQNGVAEAISEALVFSGVDAGELDVSFLDLQTPLIGSFAKVGLAFEIPELILPEAPKALAPGMDPDKPPKLR